MTVEHLVCDDCGDEMEVELLEFCVDHDRVLDSLVMQRSMTDGQRNEVVSTMLLGVVAFMGPHVFKQHGNCPVCVLEGTLERAADEVMMKSRKAN